jgi:hypothetical protein
METENCHFVLVSDPPGAYEKALIMLHTLYVRIRSILVREYSVPPFSLNCLNLDLGPISCPATSESKYQRTRCNIPEHLRS